MVRKFSTTYNKNLRVGRLFIAAKVFCLGSTSHELFLLGQTTQKSN